MPTPEQHPARWKGDITRQEVQLVVAFVDLTHFEAQAQRVTARDLADTIDDYYERVGIEVAKANGTLVKYIGDAALIVFPPDAVNEAVEMLMTLKAAVDEFMEEVGWQCRLTAKAHLGPVIAGSFGLRDAKHFDVIGRTVNAAARLKSTGVTVSHEVFEGLRKDLKEKFRKAPVAAAFVRKEDSS